MRLMTTFGLLALLVSPGASLAQDEAEGEGLELDDRSAQVAEGEIIPEATGKKGDSIYSDLLDVRDLSPPAGTPVLAAVVSDRPAPRVSTRFRDECYRQIRRALGWSVEPGLSCQ